MRQTAATGKVAKTCAPSGVILLCATYGRYGQCRQELRSWPKKLFQMCGGGDSLARRASEGGRGKRRFPRLRVGLVWRSKTASKGVTRPLLTAWRQMG